MALVRFTVWSQYGDHDVMLGLEQIRHVCPISKSETHVYHENIVTKSIDVLLIKSPPSDVMDKIERATGR